VLHDFRWIDWNIEKIEKHGVFAPAVEAVVNTGSPRKMSGGRYTVAGPMPGGLWIQVVYTLDDDGTVFVLHARSLTPDEAKRARRRR